MLDYDLSARGDSALYDFLYQRIRDDIMAGAIAAGQRLPSKRALAQHLGVSVVTVEGAYAQLAAEGYVRSRPRSGYFACELPAGEGMPVPTSAPVVACEAVDDGADLTSSASFSGDAARLWARALRQTLSSEPEGEMFAPAPAQGSMRLRRAIAAHLRQSRGLAVDPARIVVGAGAQMLDVMISQLVGIGREFAVEDPGYVRLTRIYEACGQRVRHVPLDGQGVRVDALGDADVLHVMPSHQFPTGRVTTIGRRYELLGWASAREGRWLVEDDYDCEFRMSGRPVPALLSADVAGNVIYTNTFSKSLGPAIRAAFMVLPEALADRWDAAAGFYSNTVSAVDQVALARMLESGDYERHVNRYRKAQREVRDALIDELRRQDAAARMHVEQEDSGLHFVLVIEGTDDHELASRALAKGVRLAPLSTYSLSGGGQTGEARFAMQYGGIDVAGAREAARIIAQLL